MQRDCKVCLTIIIIVVYLPATLPAPGLSSWCSQSFVSKVSYRSTAFAWRIARLHVQNYRTSDLLHMIVSCSGPLYRPSDTTTVSTADAFEDRYAFFFFINPSEAIGRPVRIGSGLYTRILTRASIPCSRTEIYTRDVHFITGM